MTVADAPALGVVRAERGARLNLLAGQLHFGAAAASLHTLLGSCVAITLWHPQRALGGMCHYLLPGRRRTAGEPRDGRFADEALELLVAALDRAGTRPADYEAHLFGGADTMPGSARTGPQVGERNIEQGWNLIERYGFALKGVDVGDHVPRHVSLSIADGEVRMRRGVTIKAAG